MMKPSPLYLISFTNLCVITLILSVIIGCGIFIPQDVLIGEVLALIGIVIGLISLYYVPEA